MKVFNAPRCRRLERFAWMVALVIVLRFVAVELHHVGDYHVPGEYCATCLVIERGGHGVVGDIHLPLSAPATSAPVSEPTQCRLVAFPSCPLPRGPPSFPS